MAVLEQIYSHVVAGAAKKEMHFMTPADITVRATCEPAYRLGLLGDAVNLLGDVHQEAKRFPEAEKAFRTAFILGYHMCKEDCRAVMQYPAGLGVQGTAIGGLGEIYSEWDKNKYADVIKYLEEYVVELNSVAESLRYKMEAMWRLTPQPGDVFAMVERDKDPAWRVEGLLLCGVIRYTHPTHAGNQRVAKKLIEQCLNDRSTMTPSGNINLSAYHQKVYINFHYRSSGVTAASASKWEVDEFKVIGKK